MKPGYAVPAAFLVLVLGALGSAASAHTSVAESSPAEGESLAAAPSEAWLRFGSSSLPALVAEDGGSQGTRLRAKFQGTTLVVALARQALVPHLEVAVRAVAGSSCPEDGVCSDLAPDLGSVRVY